MGRVLSYIFHNFVIIFSYAVLRKPKFVYIVPLLIQRTPLRMKFHDPPHLSMTLKMNEKPLMWP